MLDQSINNKKTSIIILTNNQLQYTQDCLSSIRKYTQRGTYEIIIVDNLSTDGTREWLSNQTDLLTIFNEENMGFPKGCNQGMEVATGDAILLLNNDVIVTENWLSSLVECLYSSEKTGAVGPVTNRAYGYQVVDSTYKTLDEMWTFASNNNAIQKGKWEYKLKLIGFCILIKREVIDKIGLLDEQFSPGFCEDSDYGVRILKAGYDLKMCRDVFVHHFGSASFGQMPEKKKEILETSRKKFVDKWGFHSARDMRFRTDLIKLIDSNHMKPIRVIDVGCSCGGTLLQLKSWYPNAEIYGIEKNPNAASFAGLFAKSQSIDVEDEFNFPDEYFDYMIFGNTIEQFGNPLETLTRLKKSLKKDGRIITSVFNAVFHRTARRSMLNQKSSLELEEGPLNILNKRLYTRNQIEDLFQETDLEIESIKRKIDLTTDSEEKWIEIVSNLESIDQQDLRTSQYLYVIKVSTYKENDLQSTLNNIFENRNMEYELKQLEMMITNGHYDYSHIILEINKSSIKLKSDMLNKIALYFYKSGLYGHIIPLLLHSLTINSTHKDTLYNIAYVLHQAGGHEQALHYINQIEGNDGEVEKLANSIILSLPSPQ
jgi:GT2 family glycosyltransferase/tetratricopeptide (TPR) repeat protein